MSELPIDPNAPSLELQITTRPATTEPVGSTAPLAAGLPLVKGRCPACGTSGLFLGDGGYVTCSLIDCPNPGAADDLLHRLRPTTALVEHLTETIDEAFGDHYQPGVGLDAAAMTTAVLAALTDHLDIGDAEAWCQTCRRVWDGKRHRCESDAEQRVARVHAALASFDGRGVIAIGATNLDVPTAGEVLDAVRTALGQPQDGTHVYLSTGCLHDDHDYCKNPAGLAGAKRPAECKKCGAGCICPCHTQPEEPPCTSALPPQPSPKPSPTDATPTA